MRAKYSYTHFIMYKPYSPEWHRYRYLKEAIDTYFDDYVDNEVIYEDIMGILGSRMSSAVEEVNKVMDLKDKLKNELTCSLPRIDFVWSLSAVALLTKNKFL